ncbi:MAG TPA: hypothetical protein VMV10_24070 [Pirellulales bacterium]|nr:hypothetical protein [Pirellulales bacterium]
MNPSRTVAIGLLAIPILLSVQARGQFPELAARVPETANALALFNVAQVGERNQALRANWRSEYEKSFRAGRVFLPPGASRCVASAQLDIGSLQPLWEITLVDYEQEPDLAQIAAQHHSQIESVAGAPIVSLRDDLSLVQLGANRLAALSPGRRQEASRWIKRTANKKNVTLSPYLQSALHYEEQGSDIILAIDLEDAVDTEQIRQGLVDSPTIKEHRLDVKQVVELLKGVRGLMLGVRMGDETHGKLRIDFRGDPTFLGDAAKPLLLELLSKTGAKVADLGNWTAVVEKQRVSLKGTLSPNGLRRITSLVEPRSMAMNAAGPPAADTAANSAKPSSETKLDKPVSSSETVQSSKQYFRSIQTLLDDLNADVKSSVTIGQAGVWLQKYAKRIDCLPSLNVDPDALNYGAYVSQELREASAAVKGVGITSGARRSAIYDSGNRYFDRYNSDAVRRQVNAEARAAGATSAVDIMNEIYKASGDVRRTMSERYKIEF